MSLITSLISGRVYSYEEAFRAKDITSDAMKEAISEWHRLFFQDTPDKEEDPCQRIPYAVVSKLTKTAFAEYSVDSDDQFLRQVLDALDEHKEEAMYAAMTGGRAFLKPYATKNGIAFSVVPRPRILVFGKDDQGRPTDVGLVEWTTDRNNYYTLLERRTIGADGRLTIRNQLYRAPNKDTVGVPVSLTALEKYAGLPDEYTYPVPMGLGLADVRCPVPNSVDGSLDPVAVFASATGLIHNINHNEWQLSREFELGRSRAIVSSDLLAVDQSGKRRTLRDDLFVALDEDPGDLGITIFSPALREQSFLARKTEYLRNVESLIGIKRGLLSEVEETQKTATEVTSSVGDYAMTINAFQEMWEKAAKAACVLAGVIGKLYRVPGAHEISQEDVVIDWGNGLMYDEDKTWADYMAMVAAGMIRPEIALAWKFSLPWETPEDLTAIREKYMPELSALAGAV